MLQSLSALCLSIFHFVSIVPQTLRALLRVLHVVTRSAETHAVLRIVCKLREVLKVFDVVNLARRRQPAVSLAALAGVVVPDEDALAEAFPFCTCGEDCLLDFGHREIKRIRAKKNDREMGNFSVVCLCVLEVHTGSTFRHST